MRITSSTARIENFPLISPFRISRGTKTDATVVCVEITSGTSTGRGECCPYPRYGETPEKILETLRSIDLSTKHASPGALRSDLLARLPPGSARNALDCALWDLEAKQTGKPVWQLAGLPAPKPLTTCFTLSLDTPDAMANAALEHATCPLLKLKLGDPASDAARMAAVRKARPDARLVCDANEGWQPDNLQAMATAALAEGIELIEQPLPAASDAALIDVITSVPFCADESASPGRPPRDLQNRYQAINIKLDKTGGLTSAIEMIHEARRLGFKIMLGSMVSTSLSMAPAALLGGLADWVDLDSPLLLARDRPFAMTIENGLLSQPTPDLWG